MDNQNRTRLEHQRAMLKLRLERTAAAQTFRAIAPRLCARGIAFARLPPAGCAQAFAPWANRPAQDERLLWSDIPDSVCHAWSTAAERDALIVAALTGLAAPNDRIAVLWHMVEAGLRIRALALQTVVSMLCDALHEVFWIIPAGDAAWLIEVSLRDCEICWLRVD